MLDVADTLPAKCFISHAYADAAARDAFIERLPAGVAPFVFPPITVKPDEFVSDPLINAVLDCDGLIYLRGGASDHSFWVALERDYALRAGKQVFAFDMATRKLTKDTGSPLDLAAFPSYQHQDAGQVRQIVDYLNKKRHFDMWLDVKNLVAGSEWVKEISSSLFTRLRRGGYVVVFWSRNASRSEYVNKEIERAAKGISGFNDRVLFGLLEDCPLPNFWLKFNEPAVQLYGDSTRSATQRLDDLVVRLYWLIYRKTKVADGPSAYETIAFSKRSMFGGNANHRLHAFVRPSPDCKTRNMGLQRRNPTILRNNAPTPWRPFEEVWGTLPSLLSCLLGRSSLNKHIK